MRVIDEENIQNFPKESKKRLHRFKGRGEDFMGAQGATFSTERVIGIWDELPE